jgi:hypothetical protein
VEDWGGGGGRVGVFATVCRRGLGFAVQVEDGRGGTGITVRRSMRRARSVSMIEEQSALMD